MGYSMRNDRFRYIEWRDFESGRVVARELYDHENDSLERVNVVGEGRYQTVLPGLKRQLAGLVGR